MDDGTVIECQFTATVKDHVIRRQFLLLSKSTAVFSWMRWIYVAVVALLLISSVNHYLRMMRFGLADRMDIIYIGIYLVVILALIFGDTLRVWLTIRRIPGALGPTIVRIAPGYMYGKTSVTESYSRWRVCQRIDYHRGDVYFVLSKLLAVRIPGRAFASKQEGEAAFTLASQYHRTDSLRVPGGAETVIDDSVWPPKPRSREPEVPLPDVEPPIDEQMAVQFVLSVAEQRAQYTAATLRQLGKTIVVICCIIATAYFVIGEIFGGFSSPDIYLCYGVVLIAIFVVSFVKQMRQVKSKMNADVSMTFSTDFDTIRLKSNVLSLSHKVSAICGVNMTANFVVIRQTPYATITIPLRAFPSIADARDFADRLRAARRQDPPSP